MADTYNQIRVDVLNDIDKEQQTTKETTNEREQ